MSTLQSCEVHVMSYGKCIRCSYTDSVIAALDRPTFKLGGRMEIDGIELFMKAEEFSEHCAKRADFHSKRNEFYLAKVNEIRNERRSNPNPTFDDSDIDSPKMTYSNSAQHVDPVSQLEKTAANHRQKAERFRFMATHAASGATYKLSLTDLTYLEIGA